MKRLIMLTLMIVSRLTVFSQAGTPVDTTEYKCLPVPVIKGVIKDLIKGDSAIAQLELTEKELTLNEQKLLLKDTIIFTMKEKERDYKKIIENQDLKYNALFNYTDVLEKNVTKLNTQVKLLKTKNKVQGIVIGSGLTIAIGYTAVWYFFLK